MLSLAQAARKRGLDGGSLWGNLPLSDSNLLSPFDSKPACLGQAVILGLTSWNLALFCASVPNTLVAIQGARARRCAVHERQEARGEDGVEFIGCKGVRLR
jgi:hypothetical protein